MKFNALVPELYVLDFNKSLNFYTQLLGFTIEYQRTNPQFAFLSFGESQLMLEQEEHNPDWHTGTMEYPLGRGINLQIKTTNVQVLVQKLQQAHYPLKRGLQESWYSVKDKKVGYRQFLVMDPDGYLLRFSEPI